MSRFWMASAIILGVALSGCGKEEPKQVEKIEPVAPLTEESILTDRVVTRWRAMIARDFPRAYEFETPGYRQTHTVEQHANRFGRHAVWRDAEVYKLNIEGDIAKVTVFVKHTFAGPDGNPEEGATYVDETWLRKNGQWWYVSK